ncbi:MAG TPA: carboxylating nicotinate-nucleotide diphosphorylase [Candidatus Saccharimonadales bacterium]|jgi:nicotinate-nucleotide pyrophosphorylase (carboxylating)|nr:carboxylating nicotinate-nucleotide diphosphorylase [Candidatus Saccharimonadales bacterium]
MPYSLDATAYHNLLRSFLAEDISAGDITTETTVPETLRARGELVAKAPLILAGTDLFAEVFLLLDSTTQVEIISHDGEELEPGKIPLRISASAHALLSGERVALNLLQRLSGVATLTRRFGRAVEGTGAAILDTRKTTPGLRTLEKYAVRVGGGKSHRKDLSEAVLIKENHIRMAGGVSAALRGAEAAKGRAAWIEIEVTNLDELREALPHNPHVILLDNMGPSLTREAVEEVRRHEGPHPIRTEASGGITLENVRAFAEAGVNWISVGALTHSAPAVDLSFEIEPV